MRYWHSSHYKLLKILIWNLVFRLMVTIIGYATNAKDHHRIFLCKLFWIIGHDLIFIGTS